MKFTKYGNVYETDENGECSLSKITDNEKVMTISVVVSNDFSGMNCQKCPIWYGSLSCSVAGVCPLNEDLDQQSGKENYGN